MTFNIGQPVLLLQLMGEVLDQPVQAVIISDDVRSRIYAYRVESSSVSYLVKQDWLAPAEIVIEELADTPWE